VRLSLVQYEMLAVSLACILAQIATLGILTKRKLRSEFSIFYRYTAFSVVAGVVGVIAYIITCGCSEYFYLYWICNGLLMCLQFGVMYETFVNALKPYSALIDLGKMLFRWAGVFLLLAALLTAFATTGTETNRIFAAENLMERSLGLMQLGLLLLFFAFQRRLGLSWRSYSMAVALGLGTLAAITLSTAYISNRYPEFGSRLGLIANFSYFAVVTSWAICFRRPEPARKNVLDSPTRLIFQRWNEALLATPIAQERNASMATVESFLPGIERTVDRVMARKAVS
jgi:hypothetical protein